MSVVVGRAQMEPRQSPRSVGLWSFEDETAVS